MLFFFSLRSFSFLSVQFRLFSSFLFSHHNPPPPPTRHPAVHSPFFGINNTAASFGDALHHQSTQREKHTHTHTHSQHPTTSSSVFFVIFQVFSQCLPQSRVSGRQAGHYWFTLPPLDVTSRHFWAIAHRYQNRHNGNTEEPVIVCGETRVEGARGRQKKGSISKIERRVRRKVLVTRKSKTE